MSDAIDYEKLLDTLLHERNELDRMIAWAQKRIAGESQSATTGVSPSGKVAIGSPARLQIAPDTFLGLKVVDAIRAYLKIVTKPQSARDITDALTRGGLKHKAKNLYQTVFPALRKMEHNGVVKRVVLTGDWGLAEWYKKDRVEENNK
jgi:hypothetical protein